MIIYIFNFPERQIPCNFDPNPILFIPLRTECRNRVQVYNDDYS
jgi:hypothetical protein